MLATMMIALALQATGPAQVPTSVPTSTGRTVTTGDLAPGAAGMTNEELDKVICTREAVTGTRRRERICKTARQRLAEEAAANQLRDQVDRDSGASPNRGYGGG